MKPQTLHCHTALCDGKHTPAEMAAAAFAAGCGAIGFSGHAPLPDGDDWCMPAVSVPLYRQAVLDLRERYRGQMDVFLGLEQDYFSPPAGEGWDYLIGSVHCVVKDGMVLTVDESEAAFLKAVRDCYGGNFYAFARDYFRLEAEVAKATGCQIVGHFDLFAKFNEGGRFFDESDRRYRSAALEALDALMERDVIFEINTGAMSRGYRTVPYPAPFLLRELSRRGERICLTSDSHSADTILYGYAEAFTLARSCGFSEYWFLMPSGFRAEAIPE